MLISICNVEQCACFRGCPKMNCLWSSAILMVVTLKLEPITTAPHLGYGAATD